MSSLATNPNSVHFPIRGTDLSRFLKTNNGQYFDSKPLSIHNIHFYVYIYPNGIDNKNIAYVQFLVIPNRFESTIKSVTVCCKLFCSIFQIMFKEVRILTNEKDSIEWSQVLPLSEYQKMIFKNGINSLDFVCDIEILKIKYKSNSYSLPKMTRKLSIRKQSSSSATFVDNISASEFQPRSLPVKSHLHIEWVITNKMIHLFKHSVNKKCICSQDINNMWCCCIYPNGTKHKKNGNDVELDLQLIRLPNKIKSIEVDFVVKMTGEQKQQPIEKLLQSRKVVFSYSKSHELAKLFAANKLNEMDSFQLSIIIKIIRIFEDTGRQKGNGKEVKADWSKFGFDEFKPGVFKCNADYGENKTDEYSIDEAKSSHSLTSIPDVAENISSIEKSRSDPNQRKLHQKESKELSGRPSYSALHAVPSRNAAPSITAFSNDHSSPLPNVTRELWSDQKANEIDMKSEHYIVALKTNNNNVLNELNEQCDDTEKKKQDLTINIVDQEDIFFIKFKQWLTSEVQLDEYLPNFIENGSADIKLVKVFDDQMLMNIGINNSFHRKLMLVQAELFKQGQNNFEELIKKHDVLKSCRKHFRKNALLTDDDLENMSKIELQRVLSAEPGDAKVTEIWNIIHQTQNQQISIVSQRQLQMNQFEEQYKVMKTAMEEWLTQLRKMHHEATDEKEDVSIQQQTNFILADYSTRLIDHRMILDQLLTRSRFDNVNLPKTENLIRGTSDPTITSAQNTSTEKTETELFSHCYDSEKVISELANVTGDSSVDSKKKGIITAPLSKVRNSISYYNTFTKDDKKKKKTSK